MSCILLFALFSLRCLLFVAVCEYVFFSRISWNRSIKQELYRLTDHKTFRTRNKLLMINPFSHSRSLIANFGPYIQMYTRRCNNNGFSCSVKCMICYSVSISVPLYLVTAVFCQNKGLKLTEAH